MYIYSVREMMERIEHFIWF